MGAFYSILERDMIISIRSARLGVVAFFFLTFMGLFFYDYINTYLELQASYKGTGRTMLSIEDVIAAIFGTLHFVLLFVIPAISMGSFSEEKAHNTFSYLLGSALKSEYIVIGKYCSVLLQMLIVISLSFVFPCFLVWHGNPDLGVLVSAYLGLILLVSSQISFGIWVSSLLENQFHAFIATMFGLLFFLLIDSFATLINSYSSVDTIIAYLSFSSHLTPFFKGYVTLYDSLFFVLFTSIFLIFSTLSIEFHRWKA